MIEKIVKINGFSRNSNAPIMEFGEELIRCKDCKWFGKAGCAVYVVDESDEPKENDYCSWAERKDNGADKR